MYCIIIMVKIQISNQLFNSKNELTSHTRDIVKRLSKCTITNIDYPDEFIFFSGLIKRHYRYVDGDTDIKHFRIDYNDLTKKYDKMILVNGDDEEDIFSWVKCCKGTLRPKPSENLIRAMRYIITPYVDKYKQECIDKFCVECKSITGLQTDHIFPFQSLHEHFLDNVIYKIPTEFDDEGFQRIFKAEDAMFRKSWVKYHNSYEDNFQLLCKGCNIKKSNNIIS